MDKDIRGETDMIRQAKPEDLVCIKAVAKRSKRKMNDEGNPQWNGSYPEAFYEDDIHNRQLYVYEIGGTIVGAVCISTEGHEEYAEIPWTYKEPYLCMKRLAVDPDYQGKSIAQSFFRFTEELGKEKGIHYICADTNAINEAALRLFNRANYQFVIEKYQEGEPFPFRYYEKKIHS